MSKFENYVVFLATVACSLSFSLTHAQLSPLTAHYYDVTCPHALSLIRSQMQTAVTTDSSLAGSVLRLHFHDCFVQGCDASVLLDDGKSVRREKTADVNVNSLKGFEVIDVIKDKLETKCPGVVSCADILAVAARDAVLLSGGPNWDVPLGRKDSRNASFSDANNNIPTADADPQSLIQLFQKKGLSVTDLVALIGSHTIGSGRCATMNSRIYGSNSSMNIREPNLSVAKAACPPQSGNDKWWQLDFSSPTVFDNSYYMNIKQGLGLLVADQALYSKGGETKDLIELYARDSGSFSKQFAESMVKMGKIVDTSTLLNGEVRKNCRVINSP